MFSDPRGGLKMTRPHRSAASSTYRDELIRRLSIFGASSYVWFSERPQQAMLGLAMAWTRRVGVSIGFDDGAIGF